MFAASGRLTRRRSSAGPPPASAPLRPRQIPAGRGSIRPTYLTLRDHGRVFVADLPRFSDGQLSQVAKEARDVMESLCRRLEELGQQPSLTPAEQETRIRATTKRAVTERFIQAVGEEQLERRSHPALRTAAGESLARAFLEIARHRLPGATFDSLLQEALSACDNHDADAEALPLAAADGTADDGLERSPSSCGPAVLVSVPRPASLPVVLSPDPGSDPAAG